MDVAKHFRSITGELESLKDRVRNFISDGAIANSSAATQTVTNIR